MGKLKLAIVAIIILTIPFILVYQLSKADINIGDFTHPIIDEDPFDNQCFFGQPICTYSSGTENVGEITFSETEVRWQIAGEDVWCIKIERTVAEPVSDPVGVITEETEVECNNLAVFEKSEWTLQIAHADLVSGGFLDTFIFTMKEGI